MEPKTILLVEDNPGEALLAQRGLEKTQISHNLVLVTDGEQALEYLFESGGYTRRNASDLPALVLLDLKLPKVSGFDVLRRIRSGRNTRRLPVVILSGSSQTTDVATAYDLGANAYLHKPFGYTEFQEQIESLARFWLVQNVLPPASVGEGEKADQS